MSEIIKSNLTKKENSELEKRITGCEDAGVIKTLLIQYRKQFLTMIKKRDLKNAKKISVLSKQLAKLKLEAETLKKKQKWIGLKSIENDITCVICDEVFIKVRYQTLRKPVQIQN